MIFGEKKFRITYLLFGALLLLLATPVKVQAENITSITQFMYDDLDGDGVKEYVVSWEDYYDEETGRAELNLEEVSIGGSDKLIIKGVEVTSSKVNMFTDAKLEFETVTVDGVTYKGGLRCNGSGHIYVGAQIKGNMLEYYNSSKENYQRDSVYRQDFNYYDELKYMLVTDSREVDSYLSSGNYLTYSYDVGAGAAGWIVDHKHNMFTNDNETGHWKECHECGYSDKDESLEPHCFNEDNICIVCARHKDEDKHSITADMYNELKHCSAKYWRFYDKSSKKSTAEYDRIVVPAGNYTFSLQGADVSVDFLKIEKGSTVDLSFMIPRFTMKKIQEGSVRIGQGEFSVGACFWISNANHIPMIYNSESQVYEPITLYQDETTGASGKVCVNDDHGWEGETFRLNEKGEWMMIPYNFVEPEEEEPREEIDYTPYLAMIEEYNAELATSNIACVIGNDYWEDTISVEIFKDLMPGGKYEDLGHMLGMDPGRIYVGGENETLEDIEANSYYQALKNYCTILRPATASYKAVMGKSISTMQADVDIYGYEIPLWGLATNNGVSDEDADWLTGLAFEGKVCTVMNPEFEWTEEDYQSPEGYLYSKYYYQSEYYLDDCILIRVGEDNEAEYYLKNCNHRNGYEKYSDFEPIDENTNVLKVETMQPLYDPNGKSRVTVLGDFSNAYGSISGEDCFITNFSSKYRTEEEGPLEGQIRVYHTDRQVDEFGAWGYLTLDGEVNLCIDMQIPNEYSMVLINGEKYDLKKAKSQKGITGENGHLYYQYKDQDFYYTFENLIPMKNFGDTVDISLWTNDDNETDVFWRDDDTVFSYSVREYLDDVRKTHVESDALYELCCALDNLGYASQNYFNYQPSEDSLTLSEAGDLSAYQSTISGQLPDGIEYVGASLLLNANTVIRFYFKGFTEDSFALLKTNDGNITMLRAQMKDNYGYVEIRDIPFWGLDQAYEIDVYKDSNDTAISSRNRFKIYNYSALTYCDKVLSFGGGKEGNANPDKKLVDVVKALVQYSQAGKKMK